MTIDAPNNNKADVKLSPQHVPGQTKPTQTKPVQTSAPKIETTLENIKIKTGQAIQAKVLEVFNSGTTKSGQPQFNINLEIAGKTVLVKTNIQLQPGQLIDVKLNEKGELTLPKQAPQEIDQLIKALSKVLPFQQPVGKVIAQLINNLSLLAGSNSQTKALVEQLALILPNAANLKPANLANSTSLSTAQQGNPPLSSLMLIKQAMERSGVFMESKLANQAASAMPALSTESLQSTKASIAAGSTSITSTTTTTTSIEGLTASTQTPDLKATISQSITLLNNLNATTEGRQLPKPIAEADLNLLINPFDFPSQISSRIGASSVKEELSVGDMLKLLAGALNRIQFNQLNSLYQSQSNNPDNPITQTWQMEIPFINQQKEIDPIQVRIDQEDANENASSESEKKSKWKVTLAFDFDRLGPLVVQINLMPPQISSIIWAERKDTLRLVNNEAHNLRESLSSIGLNVDDISCRHGQPNLKKTRLDQQIVDIKA